MTLLQFYILILLNRHDELPYDQIMVHLVNRADWTEANDKELSLALRQLERVQWVKADNTWSKTKRRWRIQPDGRAELRDIIGRSVRLQDATNKGDEHET